MTRGRSVLTLALARSRRRQLHRLVGDGGGSHDGNLAALHRPALAPANLGWISAAVSDADPSDALDSWDITESTTAGRDGRRDFVHFWMYSLLAVPPAWLAQAAGLTPLAAFTILNVTLLGLALWLALPRIGGAATLLLFAGPIIWWIDKPHTEAFTFAVLASAFLLMLERPWWSMAAVRLASTQNRRLGALVLVIGVVCVIARPDLRRGGGGDRLSGRSLHAHSTDLR